ncbi:MAG: hypothetical protein WCY71_00305 [Halothiobacillaceae bacterium]
MRIKKAAEFMSAAFCFVLRAWRQGRQTRFGFPTTHQLREEAEAQASKSQYALVPAW